MKILTIIITSLIAGAVAEADPWSARPGRGVYKRDPDASPWSARPGRGVYRRDAIRRREADPWHPRYVPFSPLVSYYICTNYY